MNCTNVLDPQLSARRWLLAPHGVQTVLLPDFPIWQQAIERVRQYLDYLPLSEDVKQDWIIRVLERASAAGEIEPQTVMSLIWDSLRAEMAEGNHNAMTLESDVAWRLQIWLAQGEWTDMAATQLVIQAPETPGHMPVQTISLSPLARLGSWLAALLGRFREPGVVRLTQP